MARVLPVAVFVSPHGYGHAARACAVMQALFALEPGVRFELFTEVPEWFFADSLPCPFSYHPLLTDIGLVQRTPLAEDLEETLKRLSAFLPFEAAHLDGVARSLRELGCRLAVCDIAPLGLAAARRAGIPSILVENFTWDWIYEPYATSFPSFSGHIAVLGRMFEAATAHIQTEPVCRPDRRFATVPPVSRAPRTPKATVRRQLGVSGDTPVVLVTMGGIPWQHAPLGCFERQREVTFVVPGASERVERRGSLLALPHRCGFFHPDLVHAADAVIGKLGYSTLAEVYAAGVPFGFVERPTFRESAALAAFASEFTPALALTARELAEGTWTDRVAELLAKPKTESPRSNGSTRAARLVRELLPER